MKSTKLFTILLASVLVAMALSSANSFVVSSQSATTAATAAGTAAAAPAKYCTLDIANADQEKGYYIPVITKGFAAQFWQVVKKGAFDAASDCGVTIGFQGPADETKVADQLDMLSAAVARNPSAIVYAALDMQAPLQILAKAQAEKIPIIGMDSGVAGNIPVTTAATDGAAAAAIAADHMAMLIGGSGNIAIIDHSQTASTGIDRRDGFVNELKAKYPNINVVQIEYPTGGNVLPSDDATKAILAAHPDLKGIYATNQTTAQGAVQAFTELGIQPGKYVLIGFDSGKGQIDAINSGLEAGAITQNPYGIGYDSVEAAVKVLNGVSVPNKIDTGAFWYDKTNITDPNIALLLYQ